MAKREAAVNVWRITIASFREILSLPHPFVETAGNAKSVSYSFLFTIFSLPPSFHSDCQLTAVTEEPSPPLASKLANPDEFMLICSQ